MATAYGLIMDSLNEILNDLEETGGKNDKAFVRIKLARRRLKNFSR